MATGTFPTNLFLIRLGCQIRVSGKLSWSREDWREDLRSEQAVFTIVLILLLCIRLAQEYLPTRTAGRWSLFILITH